MQPEVDADQPFQFGQSFLFLVGIGPAHDRVGAVDEQSVDLSPVHGFKQSYMRVILAILSFRQVVVGKIVFPGCSITPPSLEQTDHPLGSVDLPARIGEARFYQFPKFFQAVKRQVGRSGGDCSDKRYKILIGRSVHGRIYISRYYMVEQSHIGGALYVVLTPQGVYAAAGSADIAQE